jgi:hypothetical protein
MSFAKAEKLLDLATFAASRRQGVTLDDIIARYDISLRTAQRMLKALELRFPNAEFWYDDEGKKRCRLPGGQLRELFAVTANELSAIDLSLSHPETAGQKVAAPNWSAAGAYFVPVDHDSNIQISHEEINAIKTCVSDLLAGSWTDKNGVARPLSENDIIIVAPYNAQVNALQDKLPKEIRVGTVDKFQGQEAPICLVSMTASSAEESSRGLEFLLSLNRLNVAISRAKGLSLVFGSPRLRATSCVSVEQMRLVNTLCALPVLIESEA